MKTFHLLPPLFVLACHPPVGSGTRTPIRPVTPERDESPSAADEPAHLAGLFRHAPLTELEITERTIDKTAGRVKLELSYFEVSGVAASLADAVNDSVRTAAGIDGWAEGASELVGTVTADCRAGLAFTDLVSFGCDTMNDTRTIEDHENATGGSPAGYTGSAGTYALVDGKVIAVALADLLRPGADLAAFARRVAGEGETPAEDWRDGSCELGERPVWQLDVDGLRLWDVSTVCHSLVIPYERLVEIAVPGGVIARYVAITRAE